MIFSRNFFPLVFLACFLASFTAFNTAAAAIFLTDDAVQGPVLSAPVIPTESRDVRTLTVMEAVQGSSILSEQSESPAATAQRSQTSLLKFNGLSYHGAAPSDSVGDAGPNHYVQMVNTSFAVYNKKGVLLAGPILHSSLWEGTGSGCADANRGDPVVLYDQFADRWLLTQIAHPDGSSKPPFFVCIAVSKSEDPAGSYYVYAFKLTDAFPDYPKFGIWPDAYYLSTSESGSSGIPAAGAFAFDRNSMLNGQAGTFQKFSVTRNFMLPSDLDGASEPPAGSPNYFYTIMDDTFWPSQGIPGSDRLEIWEFKVDFVTPANSSFTKTAELPLKNFNYTVCGYGNWDCIPQPSPGALLDPVSEWPMWRFQYRNFGTHETLTGNFTIDADGTRHAGIRWFELRKYGAAAWSLYQEGSLSPDKTHRWNGSIAMDKEGNIALGYSISGSNLNPGIRYSYRLLTDAPGTMQDEVSLLSNGGVQAYTNRWGDYSSMNVDPVDNCTFWYTNQYIDPATGDWATLISTFKIPTCGCSATLSADLRIHIPFLTYAGYYFWADFTYVPGTLDFTLTDYGLITDTAEYSACTPATLSPDFMLSVPSLLYGGYSFRTDFAYSHNADFTLTGYSLN